MTHVSRPFYPFFPRSLVTPFQVLDPSEKSFQDLDQWVSHLEGPGLAASQHILS